MKREETLAKIFEDIGKMRRVLMSAHAAHQKESMPTHAQMGVLMMLEQEDHQSVKALAEHSCMSSSAVTQLVDGLVDSKLLIRKEDKEDRRKISVALTAQGKKKIQSAKKARYDKLKKLFQTLNDQELLQLESLLSKTIHHLPSYEK